MNYKKHWDKKLRICSNNYVVRNRDEEKLVISSKEAETLHSTFENTHLEFVYNFKDNHKAIPSGRR
jgi:hypothetical protein